MKTRSNPTQEIEEPICLSSGLMIDCPALSLKLRDGSVDIQKEGVRQKFKEKYKSQEPKDLQINAVVSLMNKDNTFVLAGTGYGKTRIAELFYHMYKKVQKPVVLVLNPLDALGDNQVLEKEEVNIKSINLTKTTFDSEALKKLQASYYSFIYLSPEIFLNSTTFQKLYHSKEFQKHLVLKVIDEGHCIYLWGLKQSGRSKHFSTHVTPEDVGKFRPSYGDLGHQMMATDDVPLLIMSATCRPIAIRSIEDSLRILPKNMTIIQGELTRPELRFIRLYLTHPLDSALDLSRIIGHHSDVSNEDFPPMLIYSGTQNGTLTAAEVACQARGRPEDAYNGNSEFIRRYHLVTGEKDKITRAKEYGEGRFPVMSATSALGLGQNWTRVSVVVILGAMDPSQQVQMGGRAGRGDSEGLVIIFVQPQMANETDHSCEDQPSGEVTNEDRMHAFRRTVCCLRAAYSVDNLKGYIPTSTSDLMYVNELEREKLAGMPLCRCSNCDPEGASRIIRLLPTTKSFELHELLNTYPTEREDISLFDIRQKFKKRKFSGSIPPVCTPNDPIRLSEPMVDLVVSLLGHFEHLFKSFYPARAHRRLSTLFTRDDAWQIAKNYQLILERPCLREIIGGETLPGMFEMIIKVICNWMKSDIYQRYQSNLENIELEIEQEILNNEILEENHREESRLRRRIEEQKSLDIKEQKRRRAKEQLSRLRDVEEAKARRQQALKGDDQFRADLVARFGNRI